MQFTTELYLLTLTALATALMWIPYTLARIMTRGLMPALRNPSPSMMPDPDWAERARRAHANATENLVVFAPLVLIASMLGITTPATVVAAKVYLIARLAHYVIYAAGIPVLRTLSFVAGFAAALIFAAAILGHAV
ncbi:MAPEG family protein [Rhizobium sp. No.120]